MKVALIHDNLWQFGGAERVLYAIHRMFPQAPIFTLGIASEAASKFADADLRPSFIHRIPLSDDKCRKLVWLFPMAVRQFDLSSYDLVISSSWGISKAARVRPGACHLCYCHNLLNWAWDFDDYTRHEKLPFVCRILAKAATKWFRRWDVVTAKDVTYFISNSKFTAERIYRHYGRKSTVIEPPVDLAFWKPTRTKENYGVVLSRLVPHKRVDIAIAAFKQLKMPLYVIGDGRDRRRLESLASDNIHFLGRIEDHQVRDYLSAARVTLIPSKEEFGLVHIESLACGTPVVSFAAGGALELIDEGINGALVKNQNAELFAEAAKSIMSNDFACDLLRKYALPFDVVRFKQRVQDLLVALECSPQRFI
jgi:glycosyltransferase involved in cell wall biosynthesis